MTTYIYMLKKNLTPLYVRETISNSRGLEKKLLTQTESLITPPSQKFNGQPHKEWVSSGLDTFVEVIRQQNG